MRISRHRIDAENGRVDNALLKDYGETLVGGASAATADAGYHLHFDGSSDTINVAANASLNSADFSISLWLKPDQWRIQGIMDKTDFSNSWRIFMHNTSGGIEFDALSDTYNITTGVAAPVGRWSHFVVTYNSATTTVTLYLNGVSVNSSATFTTVGNTQNNAIRIAPSANTRFDGALDDIRIFNSTLTSGEVTALYGYREGSLTASALVAHWRFDEGSGSSVSDTSSNSNTGTITGSPTWVAGSAAFGKRILNLGHEDEGLFFDGLTDYVNTGTNAAVSALTNNFTVMAWIRPADLPGLSARRILGHARANSVNGFAFGISPASSSNNLLFTTFGIKDYTATTAPVTKGVWQHVAAVLDSSNNVTFYINGASMETVTHTVAGTADSNDNFYIGAVSASSTTVTSEHFSGAIRDVRVYDTALSGANIASIYGGTHIATNLIGHWPLTETSGDTADDASASGNDGTRIGKPIWLGGEESGTVFNFTLTNECDFYFANPADSGTATSFTLVLTQDSAGSHTVTWPAAVLWPGGTVPTLSTTPGASDVFTFTTLNGGSVWFGTAARGFAEPAAGVYIAVAHLNSPRFTLLDHTTPGSVSLAATYVLSGDAWDTAVSPDGNYIAATHSTAPYFTLLNHTTAGSVSLAATYTLAGTEGNRVAFSPNGNYIAATHVGAPRFTLLNHTTPGSVSLAATYTLQNNGLGVAFSPDGNYIAVVNSITTPYFTLLNHTTPGSVSLATTYALGGQGNDVSFSPDGTHIAVAHSVSPYFTLFLRPTPGTLSRVASYTLSSGVGRAAAFSPDGDYIAVGNDTSPFFTLLNHTTPGAVSLATTYTLSGAGNDVAFSPNGSYIAVAHTTAPYFTLLYRNTPGAVVLSATYTLAGDGRGVAFYPQN